MEMDGAAAQADESHHDGASRRRAALSDRLLVHDEADEPVSRSQSIAECSVLPRVIKRITKEQIKTRSKLLPILLKGVLKLNQSLILLVPFLKGVELRQRLYLLQNNYSQSHNENRLRAGPAELLKPEVHVCMGLRR